MVNRYDERGRILGFQDEHDRWRDEEEYDRSEYRAGERERGWDEPDWDRAAQNHPAGRRFGRWYGRFGRPEGVGAAAGYGGMGGPGWTAGGFGDPGYGTAGFGTGHYGTSRYGGGYDFSPSREPMPISRERGRGFGEHARGGFGDREPEYGYERPGARWGSGDSRAAYDRESGPYAGRGPKGYQRSDERIREDVNERLTDDDRIDASGIEVAVTGGEVTLTGTVESRRTKRHAEDLAESVRGVRDVHNQLRVGTAKEDHEMSLTPEAERLRKR